MPTTYPNALSHLVANHYLDADRLGWVHVGLTGASISNLLPIVPTKSFMKESYMEKDFGNTRLTSKRRLNEEPDATSKNPYRKMEEQTAIYSIKASMDKKLMRYGKEAFFANYNQLLEDQAQDLFMDFDWDIVNGDTDDNGYGFKGFEQRVAIGDTDLDVNNSGTLSIKGSAANFRSFLELFRRAVDRLKTGPGTQVIALCNETIQQSVSVGRDLIGASNIGVGTVDILNQRVMMIDNVPLVKVRTDSANTQILPFDENGESSTSIWLVAVGAPLQGSKSVPNGVCVISSSIGLERETNDTLTQIETLQEGDFGLRVPKRSLVRLSRLLA